MIKSLRKRHLQIWTVLAVFIPSAIILGYSVVPKKLYNKLLQPPITEVLLVKLKSIKKDKFTATLFTNNERTQYQLQLKNSAALTVPSALIYKTATHAGLKNADLIGRIEGKGNYYFPLKADLANSYSFILYDIINQQIIDTIKF